MLVDHYHKGSASRSSNGIRWPRPKKKTQATIEAIVAPSDDDNEGNKSNNDGTRSTQTQKKQVQ
jgi:hypothetical protein